MTISWIFPTEAKIMSFLWHCADTFPTVLIISWIFPTEAEIMSFSCHLYDTVLANSWIFPTEAKIMSFLWHCSDTFPTVLIIFWILLNEAEMMSFSCHVHDTFLTLFWRFSEFSQLRPKWCHFYDILWHVSDTVVTIFPTSPKTMSFFCHFSDTFLTIC